MVKKVKRRDFSIKPKSRNEMNEKELEQDDIHNGDTLIEKILNSKKIRYELLDKLFNFEIPSRKDTVTMYIDLFSLLNNLYNPNVLDTITNFDDDKKLLMSSNIINIAAHFRRYFATRKSLYSNIIFYYSLDKSENELKVNENYRNDYYKKRFDKNSDCIVLNNLIKTNIELCEIISDYLPHIYFVNSKKVNPNLVPYHFIQNQLKNEFSIVYSNDKISMLNAIYNKNVLCLTANYGNVNLYSKTDLLEVFNKDNEFRINVGLLPYLLSFTGYSKYNIEGIKGIGIKKGLKKIQKYIDDGILSNITYNSKFMFLTDLGKDKKITSEQFDIVDKNIDLFHLPTMYNKLSESDIIKAFDVKDLIDIKSLVSINDEYYERYPIHLEDILMGEEYESVQ